jgi:hypothetical protein
MPMLWINLTIEYIILILIHYRFLFSFAVKNKSELIPTMYMLASTFEITASKDSIWVMSIVLKVGSSFYNESWNLFF